MFYKKKSKKKKKNNLIVNGYKHSKKCKSFCGLTSSEMELLCNSVSVNKKRFKILYKIE